MAGKIQTVLHSKQTKFYLQESLDRILFLMNFYPSAFSKKYEAGRRAGYKLTSYAISLVKCLAELIYFVLDDKICVITLSKKNK